MATAVERRPKDTSVASITYHLRSISLDFANGVVRNLNSSVYLQFENNKFPGPIVDKHTILEYVLLEKKSIINAVLNDIFVGFHRKKHDKGTNHSHEQFVLPLDDPWQQLLVASHELAYDHYQFPVAPLP